jgi:UMF1 family MFS transporter
MKQKKTNPSKSFIYIRKLFSPFGSDSDILTVAYVMYEFASRVTIFNFNILSPLYIAELGDLTFGGEYGKIIWGYVTATAAILTVFAYLSLTPIIEFGNLKRDTLIICSSICALLHIVFITFFFEGAIYLAVPFMIFAKITQRVSDVAFNALLDVVAQNKDPHQISSRCNITGYIGMLFFLVIASLFMVIVRVIFNPPKILMQRTIPIFLIGIWYYLFMRLINLMLPSTLGDGLHVPKDIGSGVISFLYGSFKVGIREQIGNLTYVNRFKDLSLFILSFVFLQGAANTAVSVAAIFTVDILHLPVRYVASSMLLGLASAILGLGFYNSMHNLGIVSAKQILLLNMSILTLCMIYALKVKSAYDIYLLSILCGSQIGTVSAYSRSIISTLVPKTRQSRLFSFYEFTQDGTSWIGPLSISTLTTIFGDKYYRNFIVIVCVFEFLIGIPILISVNVSRGENLRLQIDLAESIPSSSLPSVNMVVSPNFKQETSINDSSSN